MDTSNANHSFLCFLPEFQGKPTNILYLNGINESSSVQHFSTGPIPSTVARKKPQNGTHDSPNRTPNATAYTGLSNGHCNNRESMLGNVFHRGVSDVRSSAINMEESSNGHEQLDKATRAVTDSADEGELGSTRVAESDGNHDLIRGFMEEEDELAFNIAEFFKAFEDGQEHTLVMFREKVEASSTDSSSEQNAAELGSMLKAGLMDGRSSFDKLGILRDEECIDDGISGHLSSAGRSGKWNGYLEVDSISARLSGPLPFSGPIFYSGHSGHVPYSGSLSHRSDSSTASTHSFAFPILPCEWNSSPVKMAQPDQRYTRQRWKQRLCSFFCCNSSTTLFD